MLFKNILLTLFSVVCRLLNSTYECVLNTTALCQPSVRDFYIYQLVALVEVTAPVCHQSLLQSAHCLDHTLSGVNSLLTQDDMFLEDVLVNNLLRNSLAASLVKMIAVQNEGLDNGDRQNQTQPADIFLSIVFDFYSQLNLVSNIVQSWFGNSNMLTPYGINIPTHWFGNNSGNNNININGINIPTFGYGINIPTFSYSQDGSSLNGINIPTYMGGDNIPEGLGNGELSRIGLNLTAQSSRLGFLMLENTIRQVFEQWTHLFTSNTSDKFMMNYIETVLQQYYGNETMHFLSQEFRRRMEGIDNLDHFTEEVLRMLKLRPGDVPSLIGAAEEAKYAVQKQYICAYIQDNFRCADSNGPNTDVSIQAQIEKTTALLMPIASVELCGGWF